MARMISLRGLRLAMPLLGLMGLSACAGLDQQQRSLGTGALGGAALGGLAGSLSGNAGWGALLGAGVGAGAGYLYDQSQQRQQRQGRRQYQNQPSYGQNQQYYR